MSSIRVILEAYKNFKLAEWCVRNVRAAYPEARITVVSDGDVDPVYGTLAAHGAELIYGERLWPTNKAGLLWKRRMAMFVEDPSDYLFKIDTDTGFYRAIREVPEKPCLFGTLIMDGPGFIQGGFIGMSKAVALEIHGSGLLNDVALQKFNVNAYDPKSELNADDRAMAHVAHQLRIPVVDHPEIASRWKIRYENKDLRYAVVHPCKDGIL